MPSATCTPTRGHLTYVNAIDRGVITGEVIRALTFTGEAAALRARIDEVGRRGVTEIAYQPAGPDIPRAGQQLLQHDASHPDQYDGRRTHRSPVQQRQLHLGPLLLQRLAHGHAARVPPGERHPRQLSDRRERRFPGTE